MLRAITMATLTVAMFLGTSAYAEPPLAPPNGKQVAVNYSDLNLSRSEGAEVLITRLRAAAAQACGPAPDIRDLVMSRYYRQCVADSVERAVGSVNEPMVTEIYRGKATVVATVGE